MAKIKTATVTWITYYNCGTFLQAYALQHIVESLGYENIILNDAVQVKGIRPFYKRILSTMKEKFVEVLKHNHSTRIKRCYNVFKKKYLRIDWNTADLDKVNHKYDIFLCGSDQIWSPILADFKPYYFLNFTDKKKIAYAPSLGSYSANEEWIKNAEPLLRRFSFISVREEQGANIISQILGKEIPTVLDPTLLLMPNDWNAIVPAKIIKSKRPYLFCYLLTYNKEYLRYAQTYANEHGYLFVCMGISSSYNNQADKVIWGGPLEFLSAIKYAEVVITDSFHATIFSLLFKRDFFTLKRFKDSAWNNQNSRLENLLKKLSIEERFIVANEWNKIGQIDYDSVFNKLNKERKKSLDYLRSALAE